MRVFADQVFQRLSDRHDHAARNTSKRILYINTVSLLFGFTMIFSFVYLNSNIDDHHLPPHRREADAIRSKVCTDNGSDVNEQNISWHRHARLIHHAAQQLMGAGFGIGVQNG